MYIHTHTHTRARTHTTTCAHQLSLSVHYPSSSSFSHSPPAENPSDPPTAYCLSFSTPMKLQHNIIIFTETHLSPKPPTQLRTRTPPPLLLLHHHPASLPKTISDTIPIFQTHQPAVCCNKSSSPPATSNSETLKLKTLLQ
jgi:hypothetical protein